MHQLKKNDIMYIFAIFFILAIIYYIFYTERFKNNYIKSKQYPYKLSDIRLLTKKNNTITACANVDYKKIKIEKNLDFINKNNRDDPVIKTRIENAKYLLDMLSNNVFNLIRCENKFVDSYKLCIKKLLIYISSNNAFLNTTNEKPITTLYTSVIPLLFQSYLLINDILNKKENENIQNYFKKMNDIFDKNKSEFLKIQSHDLRYSIYSFVYGIISDNKKMYKDGFDNLNKLLTNPNFPIIGYSNKTPINNIIALVNQDFLNDFFK